MSDDNSLDLLCPKCDSLDTIHTGAQGGLDWFLCRECGTEFGFQPLDPLGLLGPLLSAAGYQVRERAGGLGLVVAFQRTDGSRYELEWLIDAPEGEPVRVRKLLDYGGWHLAADPTMAAVLAAIEAAEMADSRAGWPDMPQYHVAGLAEVQQ